MKKPYFVLRHKGSSDFVKTMPHDFDDRNFVTGWDDLAERGAITYATEADADAARGDDDSIMAEEISERN